MTTPAHQRAREIVCDVFCIKPEHITEAPKYCSDGYDGACDRNDCDLVNITTAIAAALEAETEACAKVAVSSIDEMIHLYQGKLPYFVYKSGDESISNDASIAAYTARQIATAIRQRKGAHHGD